MSDVLPVTKETSVPQHRAELPELVSWKPTAACSKFSATAPWVFKLGVSGVQSSMGAGLCSSFYWTSQYTCLSISPAGWDPSEKQHIRLVYQSLLPVWIICRLAEGALSPIIHVINEDIKLFWTQFQPLRDPTIAWSPARFQPGSFQSTSLSAYPVSTSSVCLCVSMLREMVLKALLKLK